jgi:3alpha(or 20beta)-hydroxysteroid dehydrogenase
LLSYGTIEDTSLDTLRQMNAVNVEGMFLGMKHMLECFREGGSIINIASVAGMMGRAGQIAYLMGKWAIRGLGKAAAREFSGRSVRVNTILPGLIATPMSEGHYGIEEVARMGAALPIGRAGRPADIADMVLFLASPRSGFITGAEFVCDGGGTAGMA